MSFNCLKKLIECVEGDETMRKIALFSSIILSGQNIFGMSQDCAKNESEYYPKNHLCVTKNLDKIEQNPEFFSLNSWNNPLEALKSMGLIESNSSQKSLSPSLSPQKTESNEQEVPSETPEWEKYIDWNQEELPESASTETPPIETLSNEENKCVGEFRDVQIENLPKIDSTITKTKYKFIKKNTRPELNCRRRLNEIYKLTTSFFRKDYLKFFLISDARAASDFVYGFNAGVLTKYRARREVVYSFVKKDPSWIPFPLEEPFRKRKSRRSKNN